MIIIRLFYFVSISFFVFISSAYCQQSNSTTTIFEEGSIERQFNYIIYKSSTYDDYKAVKINWLYNLKRDAIDSLNFYKNSLATSDSLLSLANKNVSSLEQQLTVTKDELQQVILEKDSIRLMGMLVSKVTYNLVLWAVILGLSAITVLVFLMFKRSNAITRTTRADLEETKEEFENFRKRTREREEKIVVEYHQELNKYKKQLGKTLKCNLIFSIAIWFKLRPLCQEFL